jgi:hypothetical protein
MQQNEFMAGVEALQLVALQTLKAVLEEHLGPVDKSPLALDILDDFEVELMGRI